MPLAVLIGLSAPASAASAVTADPPDTESSTSAERLVKSPWETHERGFQSKATCERRRPWFMDQYAGYWIGGVAESRCAPYAVPACPQPITKYKLDARSWFSPNGPVSIPLPTEHDTAPGTLPAAC
ncbi:hypothetical protein GCM10023113_22840 [Cellulomonas oligotrophica]|uniref:Secreted protein n=1 Tax=Cellulomonas oligotrophica TaxID=931536 RepID=A0ABQ4D8U9_9CELL|nr:hypothetical protein Col01nite_13270 [Cellulomonas oligotrophica]